MKKHGVVPFLRFGMAVAFLLPAGATEAEITLGPPIAVPTVAGFNHPHDSPGLAVLDDGSFAISRTTYTRGFELLFYSAGGDLLGEPAIVQPEGGPGPLHGGVGAFGDRYLVTWQALGRGRARAAFFSREGERLGRIFSWPYSDTAYAYSQFHYARGPRGRVLPFFAFQFGLDRFGQPDYAFWSQVFGPAGRFLGSPISLLTRRHVLRMEAAAINERGRFVVALSRCPRDPLSPQPCVRGFQRFDGAWRPRSPLRFDGVPQASSRLGPGLIWLGMARTGDFLAGWVDAFGFPPDFEERVFARIFRSDGTPTGRILRLNGPGSQISAQLRIRATHARTFAVAWLDSSETIGTEMYIREVDGRTGRLGEQILVATNPPSPVAGSFYAFALELNSSGHGVIWYGDHFQLVTVEPEEDGR